MPPLSDINQVEDRSSTDAGGSGDAMPANQTSNKLWIAAIYPYIEPSAVKHTSAPAAITDYLVRHA